jgi:FkbM family methyltransferase
MYYSQYRQDEFLDKVVFNKKKKGFFLDIGAHDGISFSNSYFFEKNRGFNGICFEPNPVVFDQLKKNRLCTIMNVCIGANDEFLEFMKISGYGEMLSGIISSYDEQHIARIEESIKMYGGQKEIITVKSVNVSNLDVLQNKKIDFCSIDTEGNEINILKTIDFKKLHINVFAVENNYDSQEQRQILLDNGYILFQKIGDEIFIKKELITTGMKLRKIAFKAKAVLKSHVRK